MDGPTLLDSVAPEFIIKPEANAANIHLLEKLKAGIAKKPELYASIFDIELAYANDGNKRFKAVFEYLHERPADSDFEPEASDQWKIFLKKLPGDYTIASDYEFDQATEEASTHHGPIKKLLDRNLDNMTYSQRKETKEKIKVERLRYFLGRAVAYHNTQVDLVKMEQEITKEEGVA